MKKYFKHIITKLYYRYCFEDSNLAMELINYYVPNTMRKLDGTKVDGQFFFAQLNKNIEDNPKQFYIPYLDIDTTDLKDYTIYDMEQENN